MKATGLIRNVDDLGRIVLPKSIRQSYGIQIKDPIEIFTDNECIVLKKYQPACIFCGETNVELYKEKKICKTCIEELAKTLKD